MCVLYTLIIFTSVKEVTFSSALECLFVSEQDYARNTQPIFTKFDRKVARGPQKKPLDFGGNPGHIMLGLRLHTAVLRCGRISITRHFVNSNSFAISAAMTEVCPLLSVNLVFTVFFLRYFVLVVNS